MLSIVLFHISRVTCDGLYVMRDIMCDVPRHGWCDVMYHVFILLNVSQPPKKQSPFTAELMASQMMQYYNQHAETDTSTY